MPKVNIFYRLRWLLLAPGILLLVFFLLLRPWGVSGLNSHPKPTKTYLEAVQRIQKMDAVDSAAMNPLCRVTFLTQGQKTEQAIVLVHGYTSCPYQFFELGKQFYDVGYNVLIAPMPYHGLADRMTTAHAQLTAKDLAAYADEVVDIAQGLGNKVTMMGLSVGGVVTAWAAQNRSDINLAVLVSPAFGYGVVPPPLTAAAMNAFSILPNGYDWWNPVKQAQGGVPHGYPRYSKHALAQALRLGFSVQQSARKQKPLTPLLLITNANDHQINNERTAEIVALWRKKDAKLEVHEFSEQLQLKHDLIEPLNQKEKTEEIVYPHLLEWTLKAQGDSLQKVYKLIAKTEQADINYPAIQNMDNLENPYFANKEAAFRPVKGKFTVYEFKAVYPGYSFRGDGYYLFHDILTLKTDENNQITDAYQYTLEWTESVLSDLYRSTAKNVRWHNNLNIQSLQLTKTDPEEEQENRILEENGILKSNND